MDLAGTDAFKFDRLGRRHRPGADADRRACRRERHVPSDPEVVRSDKAIARVKAVSHDCDLALLEVVEPPNFLDDIEPAELGEMPKLRDEVAVVGFPVGGEEISITEGVVSRIEVQRYSHSQRHLLAATVDAAINAGNSGGPVFGDGKVVGIAFQKLTGVDNIGEMVPPPIIRSFLDGVVKGKRPEIPALGITTQNLENPLLRSSSASPTTNVASSCCTSITRALPTACSSHAT